MEAARRSSHAQDKLAGVSTNPGGEIRLARLLGWSARHVNLAAPRSLGNHLASKAREANP